MLSKVDAIIRSTRPHPKNSNITEYCISVNTSNGLKAWDVYHRYSDFVDLSSKLSATLKIPMPALPPKKWMSVSLTPPSATFIENRREQLSAWLAMCLRDIAGCADSEPMRSFLDWSLHMAVGSACTSSLSGSPLVHKPGKTVSQEEWLVLYEEGQDLLRQWRLCIKETMADRVEHHKLCQKYHTSVNNIHSILSASLEHHKSLPREQMRRLSFLKGFERERDELARRIHAHTENERNRAQLFQGVKAPTVVTQELQKELATVSNPALLQMHRQIMQNQDDQLDRLRDLVVRQKQMGINFSTEIDEQNDMLENLSHQVDNTGFKLKMADKKLKRVK